MKLLNMDCMEYMKDVSDKYFDLVIVDPPYGIFDGKNNSGFLGHSYHIQQQANKWDIKPDKKYFDELFRISKNQIIWGIQYLNDFLPAFSQLIIWDKQTGKSYFADGEAAYCSIKGTLRIFKHQWCGHFKDSEKRKKAIQPAQKPIQLYKWLLTNYAKPDYKILDTHLGSGSHAIAWHYYQKGGEFVGIEIDKEYFEAAKKRIDKNTQQLEFDYEI